MYYYKYYSTVVLIVVFREAEGRGAQFYCGFTSPNRIIVYVNVSGIYLWVHYSTGRPGSSEVPRNPLTRWDVSSIPANEIFLTKKLKKQTKNAQRVEND